MKVTDLMTKNVRTCSPNDNLNRAAQIMWEQDCGALPVVDDGGRTVGIITDRDVCMAAYTQGRALSEIPVSVAASQSLVTVRPEDTVETVQARMQSARVRRVPVVDGVGRPIGIVGLGDVARHVAREQNGASGDPIARTLAAICQPRVAPSATPEPKTGPVYRVKSLDGGWGVFDREGGRVSERMETQADAVVHAKELARRAGSAQVIVHGRGDTVASEFFYQQDERSSLAADDSTPTMAASRPARARRPRA